MTLTTLYVEELKAMTRGRFAWLGAAVLLGVMMGFAAAATQDAWLDGFGIIAFTLVPLAFIPLTAGAIASPRANRFVESIFTSPVDRRQWLTAKVLVLLTLALAYYVALLPPTAIFAIHAGVPFLLNRLAIYGLLLLPVSVAFGALVGVMFIGKSVAPALATGVGVLLLFAGAIAYQEMTVVRGTASGFAARLAFVSPAVSLKNALGFALAAPFVPASTAMTWAVFLFVTVGSIALAAWVFLRAQGVETWETTAGKRAAIALGVLVLMAIPVAFAETNYDAATPAANSAPHVGGLGRAPGNAVLVSSGSAPPNNCCERLLNRRMNPLPTGTQSQDDLLVLLPADASRPITALRIQVEGAGGLLAVPDPGAASAPLQHLEAHDYASDSGPLAPDGTHIQRGWILRMPLALTPQNPWDLGGNRYPLNVTATYLVQGNAQPSNFTVHGAVEAQVPGALTQTVVVGSVAPLICLAAAFTRWKRTR